MSVFKVAEVLALVGEVAACEREDILEVTANSEQRRRFERQRDGKGNKSASAADDLRRTVDERGDGIVAALENFAIVHQKGIGDVRRGGCGLRRCQWRWALR